MSGKRILELNEGDAPHYRGDGYVTCGIAMESMTADAKSVRPMELWWWLCAAKYLWRWPYKGQAVRDLEKARDCIDKLLNEMGATR